MSSPAWVPHSAIASNILRINRIIYIPFETEQEAKNFKLELSDLSNLKEYKE